MSEQPRTTASPECAVCIVDDNVRTAQVLTLLLRMDGHEAESCGSARIVDRLARLPTPAVLVMSVSMGHSGAVRSMFQVRSSHCSLPLMIITEHPQLAQRLGPLQGPRPTIFTKPVDYPALLLALRAILTDWS